MSISNRDREILRALGQEIAAIAALPEQQETIRLWKRLNGLKPERPMVIIDQYPWNEADPIGELALRTEDELCRGIETRLRQTIWRWKNARADMVVEPIVVVPKVIRSSGFGIDVIENTLATDSGNDIISHQYEDQLQTEADIDRIRTPEISLDEKATAEAEEKALGIFDGILSFRMQGDCPCFPAWDMIARWHGADNIIADLIDRPEFLHRIIARLTDAFLGMLDALEEQGLLGPNPGVLLRTLAYTDELPEPDRAPAHYRAKDLWTGGMAQIFSTVSPAMHEEFEGRYAARWFERFGLGYYGCCEPLHDRIDMVRRIPSVRKISISPWADVERAAAQIGPDFVISRKPNPAYLAAETWSPEAVEQEMRRTIRICREHGCPVEFIFKDISTIRREPERLRELADVAMRIVEGPG